MVLMLLAILFSSVLTLLFKLFSKWRVHTFQAIVINYFVAVSCGVIFSGELPFSFDVSSPKAILALGIGSLFIFGFNVLARTVQVHGITVGTLMQKMSVLLTVLYALFYFNETIGMNKGIGIALAVISIGLVTIKDPVSLLNKERSLDARLMLLPVLTFVSSGIIDSLFLTGQKMHWVVGTDIVFISSLFFTAGVLGVMSWISYPKYRHIPERRTIMAGVLLGIPNFLSVYFLLKILDLGWDGSIIFPIFNVGVLFASAIMGWLIMREEMPVKRALGVIMAAISIYLISTSI